VYSLFIKYGLLQNDSKCNNDKKSGPKEEPCNILTFRDLGFSHGL
jgi:hypothetical protein